MLLSLFALLRVQLDLLDNLGDLFLGHSLFVFDLIPLLLNPGNLSLTLSILLFDLGVDDLDALVQVRRDRLVDLALSCQLLAQLLNLFLLFGLDFPEATVFTRLVALDSPLQVLNVQVLLDLGLVFLSLELCHLFSVLILLAREVILEFLVLGSGLLDVLGQHALFFLQTLVAMRFSNLLADAPSEA